MVMGERYWLRTRDKSGLLVAMMRCLVGDAHISFEGDLSRCGGITQIPGASPEETDVLRRNTKAPLLDFVVVPLDAATLTILVQEAEFPRRFTRNIVHTQIERSGTLEFGAYDYFHPECVTAGPGVPVAVLEDLVRKYAIAAFWPVS